LDLREPGQHFAAKTDVPPEFAAILALVGLDTPGAPVAMYGPAGLDRVTEVQGAGVTTERAVLFPSLDLRASLGSQPAKIFFLSAHEPAVGLLVHTPEEAPWEQSPVLNFSAKVDAGAT